MISDLFGLSFVSYFIASVLYLINLHTRNRHLAGFGSMAVSAGFTFQTVRLILQAHAAGSLFANASEAIFFLSWAIALLYLVILVRFSLVAVGALAMPLTVVALTLAYRFSMLDHSKPIAADHWLNAHIVAIVLSMATFVLAFCCAIFYLIQNKLLKSKKMKGMFRRLPPLELVDSLAHNLVVTGLVLLTLGIVTGIVGVESASLARLSPSKIMAAALTWFIYMAYIIARSAAGWRGRKANMILIAGVAAVVIATGMHRFG